MGLREHRPRTNRASCGMQLDQHVRPAHRIWRAVAEVSPPPRCRAAPQTANPPEGSASSAASSRGGLEFASRLIHVTKGQILSASC
jgi:hypothetical protein